MRAVGGLTTAVMLALTVPGYAFHVEDTHCPAPPPGVTEALDRLPAGYAKGLLDGVRGARSHAIVLRNKLQHYPKARVQQWRQDPLAATVGFGKPERALLVATAGAEYDSCLEVPVSLVGDLHAAAINVGDTTRWYYRFEADGVRYRVNTAQATVPVGRVRVIGDVLGHDIRADVVLAEAGTAAAIQPVIKPNAPVTGAIRVVVVPVHITGGVDPLATDVATRAAIAAGYAVEDSRGTVALAMQIQPLVNLGAQSGCDIDAMAAQVQTQVGGTWAVGDVLFLVGPFGAAGCTGWSGLAYLNAPEGTIRYAYVVNGASAGTWWHEILHTFGIHHSGALWHCVGKIPAGDPTAECTNIEYGGMDVMGTTAQRMLLSAWQRSLFPGWVALGEIHMVTPPETVVLRAPGDPNPVPTMACLDRLGGEQNWLCVGMRRPLGRDALLAPAGRKFTGAEIKLRATSSAWFKQVEVNAGDPTDSQNATLYNLLVGSSIRDPRTGVIVTAEAETAETLTVSFRTGTSTTTSTLSTVSSTTSSSSSTSTTVSSSTTTTVGCAARGEDCSQLPCCSPLDMCLVEPTGAQRCAGDNATTTTAPTVSTTSSSTTTSTSTSTVTTQPPQCQRLRQPCTVEGPAKLCCPTTRSGQPLECRGTPLRCRKVRQSGKRQSTTRAVIRDHNTGTHDGRMVLPAFRDSYRLHSDPWKVGIHCTDDPALCDVTEVAMERDKDATDEPRLPCSAREDLWDC